MKQLYRLKKSVTREMLRSISISGAPVKTLKRATFSVCDTRNGFTSVFDGGTETITTVSSDSGVAGWCIPMQYLEKVE